MAITRMLDLSQELYHNCPVLPVFDPPKVELLKVGPRDGWLVEQITMNLHTATHMDAPAHMVHFRKTLDTIPVDQFQGKALYISLNGKKPSEPITVADLEPYINQMNSETIVLLYTGWGEKRDWTTEWIYQSPYLSPEGAQLLVEKGVRAVGIDHFSIGGTVDQNEETHRILLGAGIWVAEGLQLNFSELNDGAWHVMALPVKIRESSGAPARVVAFQWGERG